MVRTCTTATSTAKEEKEVLITGGDETTPGELTGKREIQRVTNTVPLPEHLGERGVAVIRPGGRRGAGEGRKGQEEERVNHTKERQKGYWQRVKREE